MKKELKISKIFSLGRSIDWHQLSNRFSVVFALITFIVFLLYTFIFVTQDYTAVENLIYPFEVAILSFLGWAFAREFDPDDGMTAIFSQIIVTISAFWFFPDFGPVLLATLLLLLCVRVLNQIGGKELVTGDFIILSLIGIGLSVGMGSWLYAMIPAFTFVINALFVEKGYKSYIFALITGAVSVYLITTESVVRQVLYMPLLFEYLMITLLAITIVLRFVIRRGIVSTNDLGKKVDQRRVLIGAAFLLLGTIGITIFGGEYGYMTAAPGWAVIAAYPVVSLLNRD